jgi:hypothetical protein
MKTIEEIRHENLMALIDEAGGINHFAARVKKSHSQVSQLVNKSPESKTGKPKSVGSKQAREIEREFGKETGWLDHEKLDQEAQVFKQLPAEVRAWILKAAVNGSQRENPTPKVVDEPQDKPIQSKPKRLGDAAKHRENTHSPDKEIERRKQEIQVIHERRKRPWDYGKQGDE